MVTEGLMSLMDLITRNNIHRINPKVNLISSYAYIIQQNYLESILVAFQQLLGSAIFPSALSLILPVFMYIITLERHDKLKVIMQMHGLRESTYWTGFIINNYLLYLIVYFCFYITGRYVLEMPVFSTTSGLLMVGY